MAMSENRMNREGDKFVQTPAGNTAVRVTNDDGTPVGTGGGQGTDWQYHEAGSTQLSNATIQAAPGAGKNIYITDISVSTGSATALNFEIKDGDGSTLFGPKYLEAVLGRGYEKHFKTPLKITTAKSALINTSAAIAHSVDISGYIV